MAEVRRSDTADPPRRETARSGYPTYAEDDFSGWAWFTGGLMGLVGVFQVIFGITALAHAATFTAPSTDLAVHTSYTTWGWVHLILGLLFLVAGGGLAFGQPWARVAGIVLIALSGIVMFTFLPAAPVAVTVVLALYVLLIYGITVHGGEARPAR